MVVIFFERPHLARSLATGLGRRVANDNRSQATGLIGDWDTTEPSLMSLQHTISIRVRYPEVDGMGYLHHSRFLQYFEMGRIELLRVAGHSYVDLEQQGVIFVVVKAECRYKAPARFDDELTLTTRVVRQTHVRIDHSYELKRGTMLIAEGDTTIACVDRAGKLMQIPGVLAIEPA